MNELRDLYQEVILDHYKQPRNHKKPAGCNQHAEGRNPLCGDHLHVFLKMDGDVIQDVGFEGSGCAISTASASMMTETLKGRTAKDALTLFGEFHHLVTDGVRSSASTVELGKLEVFSGVREFPMRVKCASLAWHTLKAALEKTNELVSTE